MQLPHFVGSLSMKRASNPMGKKQMATKICQVLYPPFFVCEPHLGHEIIAIVSDFVVKSSSKLN